jgi:hypothetical protein
MIAVCLVVAKRSKSELVEVEGAAMAGRVAEGQESRCSDQWQQRRLDPATVAVLLDADSS